MIEKQNGMRNPKNKDPGGQKGKGAPEEHAAGDPAKKPDVDRPGFDLGGSTGKTTAGTGLGPGEDAAESRRDRRLPRGGDKQK